MGTAPPRLASPEERAARLRDADFWGPWIAEILARHGLPAEGREPVAGFNPTYPTFLVGGVVVKLFGGHRAWRRTHAAERAAHLLVAGHAEIAAPRLLAEGRLSEDRDAPWPYLVTTRAPGVAWRDAALSPDERLAVAGELGRQVRRVHALPPSGLPAHDDLPAREVAAAAQHSSLPAHLVAQVEDFLARVGPRDDRVFVHGDLVGAHVFVERGRLAGLIDWGDAGAADRHYELIQVLRDTFDCDKALLRAFLDACDWPVERDLPQRALALALHRQAVGLAQHPTMDVFEPVAARWPLPDLASLDELARELFAV